MQKGADVMLTWKKFILGDGSWNGLFPCSEKASKYTDR